MNRKTTGKQNIKTGAYGQSTVSNMIVFYNIRLTERVMYFFKRKFQSYDDFDIKYMLLKYSFVK